MQNLGSGVITTTQDVDCLEFDWGKIHFLSEPQVTNAQALFLLGSSNLLKKKGMLGTITPARKKSFTSCPEKEKQMVDDKPPVKVGPGASIYIPADVYHSTVNTGSAPMRLIVVYSPAGPERLLREIPGCKVTAAQ